MLQTTHHGNLDEDYEYNPNPSTTPDPLFASTVTPVPTTTPVFLDYEAVNTGDIEWSIKFILSQSFTVSYAYAMQVMLGMQTGKEDEGGRLEDLRLMYRMDNCDVDRGQIPSVCFRGVAYGFRAGGSGGGGEGAGSPSQQKDYRICLALSDPLMMADLVVGYDGNLSSAVEGGHSRNGRTIIAVLMLVCVSCWFG